MLNFFIAYSGVTSNSILIFFGSIPPSVSHICCTNFSNSAELAQTALFPQVRKVAKGRVHPKVAGGTKTLRKSKLLFQQ